MTQQRLNHSFHFARSCQKTDSLDLKEIVQEFSDGVT